MWKKLTTVFYSEYLMRPKVTRPKFLPPRTTAPNLFGDSSETELTEFLLCLKNDNMETFLCRKASIHNLSSVQKSQHRTFLVSRNDTIKSFSCPKRTTRNLINLFGPSSETEHTEYLLCPKTTIPKTLLSKTTIPNLSCVPN